MIRLCLFRQTPSTVLLCVSCILYSVAFAVWSYSATPKPNALAGALNLDLARSTPPIRMVSSTDTKGGNDDFVVLKPGQKATLATIKGPVNVVRVWFTGESVKDLSVEMSVANGGKTQTIPLRKKGTFAGFPRVSELGEAHLTSYYSYFPIDVRDSFALIVTNHRAQTNKFFYQVNYRSGLSRLTEGQCRAAAIAIDQRIANTNIAESLGLTSAMKWEGKRAALHRSEESTIEIKGPAITHAIRVDLRRKTISELKDLRLEIMPLDETVPGVDVSIPALFGQYYSTQRFSSAFMRVGHSVLWKEGASCILMFPIPHKHGLRIKLRNTGTLVTTAGLSHLTTNSTSLPPYRLCAREVSLKSQRGKPLELLDTKGEGNLIGLIFACRGTFQRNFAMLEGDEIIEVDNKIGDPLKGTGTEDFFNSSWYFPDKPFARAFHGLTYKSTPPAAVSAFRWLWIDRVSFRSRLRFLFEHGGRNNTEGVTYQAVTLWYQKPSGK